MRLVSFRRIVSAWLLVKCGCSSLLACGGAPFTIADAVPNVTGEDAGATTVSIGEAGGDSVNAENPRHDAGDAQDDGEAGGDRMTVRQAEASMRAEGDSLTFGEDRGEAAVDQISPSPSPDARPAEASPPDGGTSEAGYMCIGVGSTPFGCGSAIYSMPDQFCAFVATNVTVELSVPDPCRCAGHYTCECVAQWTKNNPCGVIGMMFDRCVVGTTNGVVVWCK